VLGGLLDDFYVVYLDDILIYLQNDRDHMEHVRRVLERLRQYKLFVNLKKCAFSTMEVEFLGFIVNTFRVAVEPSRIATIVEWLEPETFI